MNCKAVGFVIFVFINVLGMLVEIVLSEPFGFVYSRNFADSLVLLVFMLSFFWIDIIV